VYKDKILFKKVCNDSFYLNLGFNEAQTAHIPIKNAVFEYQGIKEEVEVESPKYSNEVKILLDKNIPLNEKVSIELEYEVPLKVNKEDWKFMLLYPFSQLFYEFDTKNIIPEVAYLSFDNRKIMDIKDVGQYTTDIEMPAGFTYSRQPKELVFNKEFGTYVLKDEDDNGSISFVYPSFSCLNISSFPSTCIKYVATLTPKADLTEERILWSSTLINGNPKKLSYNIISNLFYRILFFVLILVSGTIIYLLIKYKKLFLEAILGYIGLLMAGRLLPIPRYITLFDILLGITLIIIIILSFVSKPTYEVKEYYCQKCKRHHKKGKRLYDEHIGYKR